MKLYEVYILDDMDEITYLTVSSKTQEELEQHIKETGSEEYNCFMRCEVREIKEVDGYKINIEKI